MEFFELDLLDAVPEDKDRLYEYVSWLRTVSRGEVREGKAQHRVLFLPDVRVRQTGGSESFLLSELVGFAQEALSPPRGWLAVRAAALCGFTVGRRIWWCAEGSGGGRRSVICGEVVEVRFREGNQTRVSLEFPDGSTDIFDLTDDLQVWVDPLTEEGL